ncbi:MAG: MerR family transcriptional regulator [Actinomycetota bacterium]
MLLRIGELARLLQLPVRTVRYYSDTGLLPPSAVDPHTGYRRYALACVDRGHRLLALRAIGLPLDEIGPVLDEVVTDDQFAETLRAHIARLEGDIARTGQQLERAHSELRRLDHRRTMTTSEITTMTTEPKTIAFVRDQIDSPAGIAPMFPRLFEHVDPALGTEVGGNVYHHFADDGSSIDLEAVLPVAAAFELDERARAAGVGVRTIEPALVATTMHHGSFNRIHEAYTALMSWVDENGYEVAGPSYEWNIVCTPPVTQDDESYVTQVQIEIAPKS